MAGLNAGPVVAAQHVLKPEMSGDAAAAADFPGWPGAYALLIHLRRATPVRFHRSEELLPQGWYAYAGSARGPGGVGARVRRHLRTDKKPHWHVDVLTLASDQIVALALRDGRECEIGLRLRESGVFEHTLPGFGSSDCRRCLSHLLAWTG
ncbi:MAG: GIY-YIG nuclease family protein [Sphingomonadaceae bacterium]|nr:GIY-YIG nuclease family protein [Sphingomonadaceae bacterium]